METISRVRIQHAGAAAALLAGLLSAPPAGAEPPALPPPASVPVSDSPPPPDWLYLEPLNYEEGAAVPPGYMLVQKQRKWPLALGASMFGGAYVLSMFIGFGGALINREQPEAWGPMFIPVVGPFIAIQTTGANGPGGGAGSSALLAIPGAFQVLGVATLAIGALVSPKKLLVPSTPYGEVEVSRSGPRIEIDLPRIDVGALFGAPGEPSPTMLTFQGRFQL